MKGIHPLETRFRSSKYQLYNENSVKLQELRDKVFRDTKVKAGKLYQLNAIISFRKAIEWSKKDNNMSYENIVSNFKSINFGK